MFDISILKALFVFGSYPTSEGEIKTSYDLCDQSHDTKSKLCIFLDTNHSLDEPE